MGQKNWEKVLTQEKFWRTVFDSMPDLVSIHNRELMIVTANKALADRVGTSPDRLVGRYCHEVFHDEERPPKGCPHLKTIESANSACAECSMPSTNAVFSMSTTPLRLSNGKVVGCVHVAKEIENGAERREELNHSGKMAAMGRLVAGVAHELNNPLTGIIGFSELILSRDTVDEQTRRDLEKINGEALSARKIVSDLSLFARKRKAQMASVGINGILDRVLDGKLPEIIQQDIRLIKRLAPDIPKTVGDFYQLQQVFSNLIDNAIHAMSANARQRVLTVTTERRNSSKLKVKIADTGHGIVKGDLAQIFEPFYTTKRAGKGTGLGLAIVYGLVREHHGKIDVDSVPGDGAVFTIELPLVERPIAEPAQPVETTNKTGIRGHKNILVVDDDEVIGDLFFTYLKREGHRVDTAQRGDVALQKLNKEDYDLIFLDIIMGGIGGKEVYERLKNTKPQVLKGLVFVTGDMANIDTKEFLERAERPFISKPFGLEDIRKAVREAEKCG